MVLLIASVALGAACHGASRAPARPRAGALARSPVVAERARDPGYLHHTTGDPGDHEPGGRCDGVALLGGGGEVDDAFRWMIARGRGGDFVIVRASGGFDLERWVFSLGGLDSAETLTITSREGADDAFVAERVRRAEVLFFAGGDQSDYVRLLSGTALARAIDERLASEHGLVIGGTSAGLAILGAIDYSAERGSAASADVLGDPFHPDVTLSRAFLVAPHLARVITDSHFARRDRMGRLAGFLARIVEAGWARDPIGVGVDEGGALVIDGDGTARALGAAPSWILHPSRPPELCARGRPLTFQSLVVHRVDPGGTFDVAHVRPITAARTYRVSVKRGRLVSDAGGDPYAG